MGEASFSDKCNANTANYINKTDPEGMYPTKGIASKLVQFNITNKVLGYHI